MSRKNIRLGLYLSLTIVAFSLNGRAQMIKVHADLDTNTIELGGQVNMNIFVEKPAKSVVIFPAFKDTLFGTFEILYKGKPDTTKLHNDNILIKQKLTLAVFDTGLFYIPPIEFICQSEEFTDTLRSNANYLEVLSFPIDTTNSIRDIKGLYKAPVNFREIFPYFLSLVALALLVWFIVYYYKKKKRNEPVIARGKPVDPPDIIAIRALDQLNEERLWQQGRVKEYYSCLTDILREYIEKRYGLLAREQTSFEILAAIEDILQRDSNYAVLRNLLPLADLVKFAKANPEPDENLNHLENAYRFVRNTRHQQIDEGVVAGNSQQVETVKAVS
jgi:hypothetical protein